jgi:hypothetical protein
MDVLTNMEMDDEDKLDAIMPMPMANKPDFPFGLRICMNEKDFEKLKMDHPTTEDVEGTFTFKAMARITNVSASSDGGDPCCRVECQIEAMKILDDNE